MSELNNELFLKIANHYKTPCFIYDSNTIFENYQKLRNALPRAVDIFYSIKANPAIALIQEIYQMGAGVELCSYFEIEAAILAGVHPERMIFVGPGKSAREIEKCLELQIYSIVCESESELELISEIARRKEITAAVAIRINPLHTSKTAMLKMGGQSLQFGMDEEFVLEKIPEWVTMPHVKIMGIHAYHGTRILDAETIAENTKYIFDLAKRIQGNAGFKLEFIDIGGGVGVPYFSGEDSINFEDFKNLMSVEIGNHLQNFPKTKIILEVGRFLVAESGFLLSQIMDIKVSRGVNIIVTNGGANCFMAASQHNSFLNRSFQMSLISNEFPLESEPFNYTITGPLCTPSDVMGRAIRLPQATIGDYIVIHNAGAYGPTASPGYFLSHGFPAEIVFKNNKITLIRERSSAKDFFENQLLPRKREQLLENPTVVQEDTYEK